MTSQQQMSEKDDQWRSNCSTLGDSIGHFFLNEYGADIWFVPLLNAANPPRKFPAHKFVMIARSKMLDAQFRFERMKKLNESKENKDEEEDESDDAPARKKQREESLQNQDQETVELPDVEPEAFQEFLRFCYTDKAEINAENATSILYTANRYDVPSLVKKAIAFLCENIKVENAFEMLNFVEKFNYDGIKEVENAALEIIRTKTEEVVKTEAFLEISPETLELIVSQDQLSIKQVDLFQRLIRWAKKRQTIAGNKSKTLRKLLGQALFHIQFWQMDIEDFGRFVAPKKVLTNTEALYVYHKLSTHEAGSFYADPECPFPRFGIYQNSRLLTLEITNTSQFAEEKEWSEWGDHHRINGYTFSIYAGKEQSNLNFCIYVYCRREGSENWSCNANAEVTLVNKAPGKRNKTLKLSHQFMCEGNFWDNTGYPEFITIKNLLEPENGWIDEDDTVTVKALIRVVDNEVEENRDKGEE